MNDSVLAQVDVIEGAQFVDFRVLYHFNPKDLREDLLKVLPLWCELAFESPLRE